MQECKDMAECIKLYSKALLVAGRLTEAKELLFVVMGLEWVLGTDTSGLQELKEVMMDRYSELIKKG